MTHIFEKAKHVAEKIAGKTVEGVSAAKDASVHVAGKVAEGSTKVAKAVAEKVVDAAHATADAVKGD